MDISVTVDEDAHQFASIYEVSKGITLDAAICELIRKAEALPQPTPDIRRSASGLACFPSTGNLLTSQMVEEAENDLD